MVTASAKDDKDLLDSLQGTDWQRTRGDEVAMVLELALAFSPKPGNGVGISAISRQMTGSLTFTARIHQLHHALDQAEVAHAFGGAIALGWCVPQARATNDIDINIFLPTERFKLALDALPEEIEVTERSREQLRRDGQTRLRWGVVPVDVFLNTTELHRRAATRVRRWDFVGVEIPCLSCDDLAVFKAFYDARPKTGSISARWSRSSHSTSSKVRGNARRTAGRRR